MKQKVLKTQKKQLQLTNAQTVLTNRHHVNLTE